MDRVMLDGEPFSLKTIDGILNQASFKKVKIFDPHSEVTTALVERSYNINNHSYVGDCLNDYFSKCPRSFLHSITRCRRFKKIHPLARY